MQEQKMFVAGQTWDEAGTFVAECTVKEAVKKADLDWQVEAAPIVTDDQKATAIDKYNITRRVDNNAILGIVKAGFKPIQNMEAFSMFDRVIQGKAIINTAGQLQGGSKVWMLARMPDLIEVSKDDPIEKYMLLSNSHDGRRPLSVLFTPVRVICENTLNLALGEGKNKFAPSVSIKHDADSTVKMKEAERVMAHAFAYFDKFKTFVEYLTEKQMVEERIKTIIEHVFPPNKKLIVTQKIANHRLQVRRLFDEGKGHDKIAGTAWALVNAFGEYADHSLAVDKNKEDFRANQMRSIWFGAARGLKQRATNTVLRAVL